VVHLDGWLVGVGPVGSPAAAALGEGAVAALFPVDQSQISIDIVGINDLTSTATIAFFRRDGSLIQQIALQLLTNVITYGFARDGDVYDIAGFSLYNDDFGGIAFPGIAYNSCSDPLVCSVPEPSLLALILLGGAVLTATRRFAR
jgi:hypothetical protein